jgi:hypothetical protein
MTRESAAGGGISVASEHQPAKVAFCTPVSDLSSPDWRADARCCPSAWGARERRRDGWMRFRVV